ncbi:transglycosylase domain-containing protein, partial [Mycobacterium tuberculosis]
DTIKDAVVAAENQTFWTDSGIDFKGIARAVFNNASGGSTQGASTITQQYVKVLYLTQEQSYKRKLKEAILALKLQQQISKTELLAN